MTITIDGEFRSLIPPLSDLERLQLEETLEKEGCRDPLITWRGILIDGHNRHEICERLGLEYTTREIVLADRDSVKQWMYRNQLGRRNLSPTDAAELRGLMYNSRKQTKGGDRKSKAQNDPLIQSTANEVAAETGVSPATVKRDGEYAESVAEVAEIVPDIRQQVRKGTAKKKDVIAAAKVAKSSPEKAREIVASGKATKPAKSSGKATSAEHKAAWEHEGRVYAAVMNLLPYLNQIDFGSDSQPKFTKALQSLDERGRNLVLAMVTHLESVAGLADQLSEIIRK